MAKTQTQKDVLQEVLLEVREIKVNQAHISQDFDQLNKKVEKIDHSIRGNGEAGISERMRNLEAVRGARGLINNWQGNVAHLTSNGLLTSSIVVAYDFITKMQTGV